MDIKAFLNKEKCERCGQNLTAKTMSYFNTDTICLECSEKEKQHPLYEHAVQKDRAEFADGNYYYDGLYAGINYEDIPSK
ncbi:MAG: gamma-glutamylcyclotransferase [Peptococcaceae bacterium]